MRQIKLSAHRYIIFATGLFLMSCIARGQETKLTDTDLCSLIARPKQFNNKRVRVNARVESTVIEGGTWLRDASCERSGVELLIPDYIRNRPEEHRDFKALDDAIRRQGNVGTVGKRITATFTGKFASRSRRPKRVLILEKVENLDVKMETPSSKQR